MHHHQSYDTKKFVSSGTLSTYMFTVDLLARRVFGLNQPGRPPPLLTAQDQGPAWTDRSVASALQVPEELVCEALALNPQINRPIY
jgi:hypothetical protein